MTAEEAEELRRAISAGLDYSLLQINSEGFVLHTVWVFLCLSLAEMAHSTTSPPPIDEVLLDMLRHYITSVRRHKELLDEALSAELPKKSQ